MPYIIAYNPSLPPDREKGSRLLKKIKTTQPFYGEIYSEYLILMIIFVLNFSCSTYRLTTFESDNHKTRKMS